MSHWKQREGGGLFAIWLIRTIALRLGRGVARVLLYPIALYFFLRRAHERTASRAYLSRVLDRPVTTIEPATLAPLNYLDAYAQPRLNQTLFTSVGYGTEVRKPDSGPQKPQPMSYPLIRRYVEMPGQKLTPQILQTNGNDKDNAGTGGTCFGDSGGPTFLNGYVVTVTSYTYTQNCRYLGGYQRVDITVVRQWLATFGVV